MTKGWAGGRATVGGTSGRLYFEVTMQNDGLCRAGWASRAAAFEIGRDKRSFGFGSTGKKSHGGTFTDYGRAFGKVGLLPSQPKSRSCQLITLPGIRIAGEPDLRLGSGRTISVRGHPHQPRRCLSIIMDIIKQASDSSRQVLHSLDLLTLSVSRRGRQWGVCWT